MDPVSYNYPHFDEHIAQQGDAADERSFRSSFRVGRFADDVTLLRLEANRPVSASELWRSKPLVMEFGSFT